MNKNLKLLLAYDGSTSAETALDDLLRAGLPAETDAIVISVADIFVPPHGSGKRFRRCGGYAWACFERSAAEARTGVPCFRRSTRLGGQRQYQAAHTVSLMDSGDRGLRPLTRVGNRRESR